MFRSVDVQHHISAQYIVSGRPEIESWMRTSFLFLQDRQACKRLMPQTTEQPICTTMRPTWFLRRAVRAALVDALGMVLGAGVIPAEDLAWMVAAMVSKGFWGSLRGGEDEWSRTRRARGMVTKLENER